MLIVMTERTYHGDVRERIRLSVYKEQKYAIFSV